MRPTLSPLVHATSVTRADQEAQEADQSPRTRQPRIDRLGDAALLAAWADIDRAPTCRQDAFRELVSRHGDRVFAICLRELGCRHDAQDATQDTFAKAARAAHGFRGDSAVTTWLYRIAINTCRDLQRRSARRPATPVDDIQTVAEATSTNPRDEPAEAAVAHELAGALQHALDRLAPSTRTLIVLCAIEGMPYPQAAKVLDLPVGTIKSRIFRARAKLADSLDRQTAASGHCPSSEV